MAGNARAQNSVWDDGNSAKKTARDKVTKAKHKAKDFKEHLQRWGIDTNYNHAFLIGGKLNSDGWSGTMNFIKRRNYKLNDYLQVSLSEIKHEKQTKQQGMNSTYPQLGNTTPYVFGKINNLYTLQIGIGQETLLLPAVLDNNLSVSLRYSGGLSIGLLKPYYLKLIYHDNNGNIDSVHVEQHKYTSIDSALFLNNNKILGASKWSKGLDEISYVPGAYFETALAIIPGRNKYFIQEITLGVNGAIYAKPLSIMADQVSYAWQFSLFAGLLIGERWK
jgi:hypothetical protein